MRASRATGSAAAQSAAAIATPSSDSNCSGKTWNGSRQPKAFTFTIAKQTPRHQQTQRKREQGGDQRDRHRLQKLDRSRVCAA